MVFFLKLNIIVGGGWILHLSCARKIKMKINQAVKIVESCYKTREPHQQSLGCLIRLNQRIKEIHGKKLFTFFEMVCILNSPDEALSYIVSNIDIFTSKLETLKVQER